MLGATAGLLEKIGMAWMKWTSKLSNKTNLAQDVTKK
jgi:hypothetical protein